ncbi:TPA: hypothetical protein DIC39_02130 [Patescibacteria group bacterium]|nr:hypothetical protein [Patescibacteria group bacterium]HCU47835.1 hypothetical protein [Patescibacteria group bacterium]
MPQTTYSISQEVLFTLGRLVGKSFTLAFDFYRFRSAYLKGGEPSVKQLKKNLNEVRIKKAIRDLARNKYLESQKIGKRLMLSLTDKGQMAVLRYEISWQTKRRDVGTLIVFDIPESQRLGRDHFRRWLKDCDFKMIQRSVWFTDRDVVDHLQQLVKQLRLSSWIRIFSVKL